MDDKDQRDEQTAMEPSVLTETVRPTCGFQTYAMEPLLILYMFSVFIKYPVFQTLIYEKSCIVRYENDTYCQNTSLVHKDVTLQTDANHLYLLSTLCILLPSIPLSLILGSLSDVWNVKVPILVPLFGLVIGDINYILQCIFTTADPRWLLLSDLACGFCGGFSALIGTVFSYSTKYGKTSGRGQKIAFLEGGMGLGATIGFLSSGVIRRYLGFSGTFLFILFLHIICILYMIVLAKNIPVTSSSIGTSRINQNSLMDSVRQRCMDVWLIPTKVRPTRLVLLLSLLALVLELFSFSGVNDIQYSFFRFRLKWTDKEYGWYSGLKYGLGTIMVLFLYPALQRCGFHTLALCSLGLLAKIVSLIATAFVFANWFAFAVIPLSSFNRFISAALRTTVSESVELYEQGRIFSVISIFDGIVSMVGSLMFNTLYPLTLPSMYYLCYLAVAAVLLVPLLIVQYLLHYKRSVLGSELRTYSNNDVDTI